MCPKLVFRVVVAEIYLVVAAKARTSERSFVVCGWEESPTNSYVAFVGVSHFHSV